MIESQDDIQENAMGLAPQQAPSYDMDGGGGAGVGQARQGDFSEDGGADGGGGGGGGGTGGDAGEYNAMEFSNLNVTEEVRVRGARVRACIRGRACGRKAEQWGRRREDMALQGDAWRADLTCGVQGWCGVLLEALGGGEAQPAGGFVLHPECVAQPERLHSLNALHSLWRSPSVWGSQCVWRAASPRAACPACMPTQPRTHPMSYRWARSQ
eukprot:353364-Chlamydomonas_euryale.AAC.9